MQRDDISNSDSSWSLINEDCDLIEDPDSFSLTDNLEISYATDDDINSVDSDVQICEDIGSDWETEETEREQREEEEREVQKESYEDKSGDDQISLVDEEEGLQETCARYYASPELVASSFEKHTSPESDSFGLNCQKVRIATTFSVIVTALLGFAISSSWSMERCLNNREINGINLELFATKEKLFSWRDDDWEEEKGESFDYVKSIEHCQKNLREVIRVSAQKSVLMRYVKLKEYIKERDAFQRPSSASLAVRSGEIPLQPESPQPCLPEATHPCHSWPRSQSYSTPKLVPPPCDGDTYVSKIVRTTFNLTELCPITFQLSNHHKTIQNDIMRMNKHVASKMINGTCTYRRAHPSCSSSSLPFERTINPRRTRRLKYTEKPSYASTYCYNEFKCNLTSELKQHLGSSSAFQKLLTPKEFNSYITFLDLIPPRQCKLNSTLLQCEKCWWTGVCQEMKKKCTLRRWQRLRKVDPKSFTEKDTDLQAIFKKIGWSSGSVIRKQRTQGLVIRRSTSMAWIKDKGQRRRNRSSSWLFRRDYQRQKLREDSSRSDWFFARSSHRASLRARY